MYIIRERKRHMEKHISKIDSIMQLLPSELAQPIGAIPQLERMRIQEIRLRSGKFLTATVFDKEYFVRGDGKLVSTDEQAVRVSRDNVDTVMKRALQFSVHSYSKEISAGYMTVAGGCRVGFCGTAVVSRAQSVGVETVKNVSSVNIRIAREVVGAADELMRSVFSAGLKSLLIIGVPSSGKTTVLRDLCRSLGKTNRLSVIDERNEIAAVTDGEANNDVGILSDIFTSYEKYDAIMTAVKVMSPSVLVCDEIGSKEDMRALEYAVNSGVKLIATTHAPDYDSAKRRSGISKLIKDKEFDYACVLGTGNLCGKVVRLVKIKSDD